jgi:hypothetical protein
VNRARFLLGLASVLAGTTVLLAVLGVVYNLFFLVLAVPFGIGAYLIWADATGRIEPKARARRSRRRREPGERAGRWRATSDGGSRGSRRHEGRGAGGRPGGRRSGAGNRRAAPGGEPGPTPGEARRVLGVAPDADEDEIRRAYRERAKEVHPDAAGGDEEAFKRVTEAYERLVE